MHRSAPIALLVVLGLVIAIAPSARGENRFHAAMMSITRGELEEHVITLADDVYEGRLAGSRGGRAAGKYVAQQLEAYALEPAGGDGTYFQAFNRGYRNILALHAGSDPELADEVVVVSAHYDHVGYGTARTSYGPTGYIHNGADDNASGVSALLETIEAFDLGQIETRRPILFAFWDGEELGLLGSKHWVDHPTIDWQRVKFMVNIDMVGWLRENRLEVGGTRSGYGTRRLMCGHAEQPLWLDFNWEMESNSDHYTFFERRIPIAFIHTGLHDHYHRPTDDVERINHEGMQDVSRYLFGAVVAAANADVLPSYRDAARHENPDAQRRREQPAPPLPPRIGINWQVVGGEPPAADELAPATTAVEITRVVVGSPAAAGGLRAGDRIVAVDGRPIVDVGLFQQTLQRAEGQVMLAIERPTLHGRLAVTRPGDEASVDQTNDFEQLDVVIEPAGPPVRLGISWRDDDAEPGAVFLSRVVPGSPAAVAGLEVYDRVYEVDGRTFTDSDQFSEMVVDRLESGATEISLLVETTGNVRPVVVRLTAPRVAGRALGVEHVIW
jgi:hypothetical protein